MNVNCYNYLDNNLLQLVLNDDQQKLIILDDSSGKIVFRSKVDAVIEVRHTGIWLGTDFHTGEVYVIHNHYDFGGTHIATLSAYAAGQQVHWKKGSCTNDPRQVINKGLDHVVSGRSYNGLIYNCHTFTNTACYNNPISENVRKWLWLVLGVLLAGVAVAAFGT
ncbi:MAG: hypothetical protein ACKVT2_08225 [Saprospiraceae bacterium]